MKTDRALVLMYHRIGEVRTAAEARYSITASRFAEHMHALSRRGYRAVPVEALVAWIGGGPPLRGRDFVLTFDDGFLGVRDHALPVLEQLGWPFAVFLVTDMLGGVDAWQRNDGSTGGRQALLSAADVRAMGLRGGSFHSHTRRHLSLPTLGDGELADELIGSRNALSALLGAGAGDGDTYLAYPYGHVDDRVAAAARQAGYKAGFSVQSGFNRRGTDPFRIRRLDVFGTDTPGMLLRKLRFGSNDGGLGATLRYYARRISGRLTARSA
jgi:peptidoglycan/xylan/chitin deacetylase (PgdA/CDA1 family)